jgi:hypothetical protein
MHALSFIQCSFQGSVDGTGALPACSGSAGPRQMWR